MHWMIYSSVVTVMLLRSAHGHTLHTGRSCPNVLPFPNIDVEKILGSWYVLYKTDTDNTCLMWNITRDEIPDTLKVKETRQLSFLDVFGVDHTHAVTANIDIPNPEVPGKMRIRWPTSLTGKADFIVFDTDYDSYMAVFECDRAGIFHRRSTSILSRRPTIDGDLVRRVRRLLDTSDVGHYYLTEISHNACRAKGHRNWHIQDEFFGLVPIVKAEVRNSGREVPDYDVTQLEIVEDAAIPNFPFQGSFREGRPMI